MPGKGVAGFGPARRFEFDDAATPAGGPDAATEAPPPAPTRPAERPKAVRPPSRQGKRNVNFVLSEAAWEQLSILSIRTRRPIQDLMTEATDLLFQANSLSRIARE
jgi:hypothetical protein